ncbi:MAG: hypothetical protein Q4Q18_07895 [Methanobrevibacter sp.]|nr:hypothetical protein [Methanobrevibacter sp.]
MSKKLTVTKSNKKLNDYEKDFEISELEKCDALFITEEYNKYNSHLQIKNVFLKYLEETNEKVNIIEYKKNIDSFLLPNTEFWNIAEFIIREIALPVMIGLLVNFISSKMKDTDNIQFSAIIERKDNENINIQYNGNVEDFKTILNETDNFNEILKDNK